MNCVILLLLVIMVLCVVMQPCEAKAARNGKPAKEAAVDSEDLDRQLEEMKARIESQLPPKESDDDSISNAELGLMELARSAKNPKLMAQALEDLKDPEIAAQVQSLMKDPEFQREMKAMMDSPRYKAAMARASVELESLVGDPGAFNKILAKARSTEL